jgi:hypothetical protein
MGLHLMGVHLMGVPLMGVHLIGVHLIGAESLRAATFGSHITLTANFSHERILGNTARNSTCSGRIRRWRYNLCEATSYKGPERLRSPPDIIPGSRTLPGSTSGTDKVTGIDSAYKDGIEAFLAL